MATGWLDDHLLLGAESADEGLHARGQYHPATVHWQVREAASAGCASSTTARRAPTAGQRSLDVECSPHRRHGPQPLHWESNIEAADVRADRWSFPGLQVRVTTDATLADARTRTYTASGRRPDPDVARLLVTPSCHWWPRRAHR